MIKRPGMKAPSRGPVVQLPAAALAQVTGGVPSIDAQTPGVWMREIVHVQARK